jgi:hypothetical protein
MAVAALPTLVAAAGVSPVYGSAGGVSSSSASITPSVLALVTVQVFLLVV